MTQENSSRRVLMGLLIIFFGGALLLKNLGYQEYFFDRYIFRWENILIGIGLISLLSHEGAGPGTVLLFLGGAFYLRNEFDFFRNINFWQLLVASIFIIAGLMMIVKRKPDRTHCNSRGNMDISNDTIEEMAIFGGGDRTVVSENFRGGKIVAVFGGSNFNMMRSKLAPGKNYIDVLAVFGGFKLVVPEDWDIKISTVSIFGGFTDKHRQNTPSKYTEGKPILIIKGFILFGGGEIKSY